MASLKIGKGSLNNSELWAGVAGLLFGTFVIWSGHALKVGSISDPGSGYVLFYTGMLICILAVVISASASVEGGRTFAELWAGASWPKPLTVIVCLAAFSLLLEPAGFILASIPLLLLLFRMIEPVRWTLALPLAVLVPLGIWWILSRLLLIQLPSGFFHIG